MKYKSELFLIERAQRGDLKAFNLLVAQYQVKIRRVVMRYVSCPQDQLDVVQEVFLNAFRGLAQFRSESKFFTWLYRIACNTSKNYLKARKHRPPDQDIDALDAEFAGFNGFEELASPEHLMLRDEIERTVFAAIGALPGEMQDAILLREMEGLSYEAIAQTQGCAIGTVRSRIFRAREIIDQSVKPFLQE